VDYSGTSHSVELDAAGLRFDGYPAMADITFSVPAGQFVAIVGPTGCGKSSILNLVAGLIGPTLGVVRTTGRCVTGVNPNAAYMFQQDALFPWKRVLDNVMFGPILRGATTESAREQALGWIDRVGLSGFADRYPYQLSGGQRKRVAMAQVLINRLPLLLMDEPFSPLDVQTRALMENELLDPTPVRPRAPAKCSAGPGLQADSMSPSRFPSRTHGRFKHWSTPQFEPCDISGLILHRKLPGMFPSSGWKVTGSWSSKPWKPTSGCSVRTASCPATALRTFSKLSCSSIRRSTPRR
jgi:ABC-type nitrate/sulfonate/bicarbonate transport system ATPase subunit